MWPGIEDEEDEAPGHHPQVDYDEILGERPESPETIELPAVMSASLAPKHVDAPSTAKVKPFRSAAQRMREASREDARNAAADDASDALYAAFARKPIQKLSHSPSQSEALGRELSIERQGKQDSRQDTLDAQNSELVKARIAALGRTKAGKTAAELGDRTVIENMLGLKPGSLQNVTDKTLERITGITIAKENRAASENRLRQSQDFTAGQKDLDRQTTLEAARVAQKIKEDDKTDADAVAAGKDLEGTADLKRSFDAIDSAVPANGGDVPGIGPWDARKPEIFDSQSDTVVKQGLKQIIAKILKKQSGSTVSEDEYKRTLSSYGINPTNTESQFRTGYAALKQAAILSAKEAEAKHRPEAVDRYHKRGGVISSDFGERTPAPPKMNLEDPQSGVDDIVLVLPPGASKPVRLRRSKLQKALAAGGKLVSE